MLHLEDHTRRPTHLEAPQNTRNECHFVIGSELACALKILVVFASPAEARVALGAKGTVCEDSDN